MPKLLPLIAASVTLLGTSAMAQPGPRVEGDITKDEMVDNATERFERLDTNDDGFLSRDEVESAGEGRFAQAADRLFDRQDTNQDGMVSLEEALAHSEARFDEADADGDGILTEEERAAARQEMRQRLKNRRG